MLHSAIHSKRYQHVNMPHSQYRFNSLKASHSYFQNHPTHLTKRHSLDSRPHHNPHKNLSYVQNVEDFHLGSKNWMSKQYVSRPPKSPFDDNNVRVKYFWRRKNGKSTRKDEKSRVKKVKRNWSQLGKQQNKKQYKPKYDSISKYQNNSKANISDRLDTKNEVTNGKSNQSSKVRREQSSGERTKIAKSLLNSTMLTKRQSIQRKVVQTHYQDLIVKVKNILQKYEKKLKQLKDQKQYYKQKLKKEKKKKIESY